MDGITGLQLLDTIQKINENGFEEALVFLGAVGLGISLLYLMAYWNDTYRNSLICTTIVFGLILTVGLIIHLNLKPYNEYKCAITDENYHIDLDKYEIIKIEGKLITLKDINK